MLRIILYSFLAVFFAMASPATEPVQVMLMSFNTWYGEGIELARSRFSIIPADARHRSAQPRRR
ncbi:MAG: hypothetical protein Q8L53_15770 [Aestuariivirga sp.]|nr:hypothetical protein [Aestuariivirga sp.]